MRCAVAFWKMGIIGAALLLPSMVFADLFNSSKIDTNIKSLVFPQSLLLVQYCGYKTSPLCFMLESGNRSSENLVEKETLGLSFSEISQILSDQKVVKRILKKVDPARIVPVKIAEPVHEFIMYNLLQSLTKQYEVDIVLAIKSVLKLSRNPNDGDSTVYVEGIIYLAHQQVIIGRPSGEQEVSLQAPNMGKQINDAFKLSLKELAKDARRIILSYKYEKRRSNY